MANIGLFTGTFDPIHMGHVAACLAAQEKFDLEQILIMVEPKPWRKTKVTPYDLRYEMTLIATQQYPNFVLNYAQEERFAVTTMLPDLQARHEGDDLYHIIGSDEFLHLPNWQDVDEWVSHLHFVVPLRSAHQQADIESTVSILAQNTGVAVNYQTFKSPYPDVSSSQIKQALQEQGHSNHLNPQVEAYIKDHRLYEAAGSASKESIE